MAQPQHVISSFGRLADDFFVAISLLKSADPANGSLPFLHAHVLELSAKAACLKLSVNLAGLNGHNICGIYQRMVPHLPAIATWIPTPVHLTEYRKIWFPEDAPQQNVALPPGGPAELDALELAYFVSNVMNLKYGFTKDHIQVSCLQVACKEINSRFLALFRLCRETYADTDQDQRLKETVSRVFGPAALTGLHQLIGI